MNFQIMSIPPYERFANEPPPLPKIPDYGPTTRTSVPVPPSVPSNNAPKPPPVPPRAVSAPAHRMDLQPIKNPFAESREVPQKTNKPSKWATSAKNSFRRVSHTFTKLRRPSSGQIIERNTTVPTIHEGSMVLLQGQVAVVPSHGRPGWISSSQGMFRVTHLPPSCMTQGQLCTFQSNDRTNAANVRVSHSIAVQQVAELYDKEGRCKWDATLLVIGGRMGIHGTYEENEFIGFDHLDLADEILQNRIEETLNAFANQSGGTIHLGVRWEEHVISGVLLSLDEQKEIEDIVEDITTNRWTPEIPNRQSKVAVTFVPLCTTEGEVCRNYFVVRISIQGPMLDANSSQIVFQMKRNGKALIRKNSFNAEYR